MLTVETHVSASSIAGMGLFASRLIRKGELIWKLHPGFDISIPPSKLDELGEVERKMILTYAYIEPRTGEYVLCCDAGKYMNHSDTPNTANGAEVGRDYYDVVASEDIQPNTEITCDYFSFDSGAKEKLTFLCHGDAIWKTSSAQN